MFVVETGTHFTCKVRKAVFCGFFSQTALEDVNIYLLSINLMTVLQIIKDPMPYTKTSTKYTCKIDSTKKSLLTDIYTICVCFV